MCLRDVDAKILNLGSGVCGLLEDGRHDVVIRSSYKCN